MGFDNTIDNRWRPDFESSQRRVREELGEGPEPPVVYSRELSYVPARRPEFAANDPQTRALIAQYKRLERMPHGEWLNPRLEDWRWMDRMKSPDEKQRFLEPMIAAVRRDPVAHEPELIFLLLVLEPVRRSVRKAFIAARAGLVPTVTDFSWANRAEAKMLAEIDRQQLYDVTRTGAIEAIFRYPAPPPRAFFPWAREAIAHRTLDHLRGELAELEARCVNAAEAEAVQAALAGLADAEPPPLRDGKGLPRWRARIDVRSLYRVVDEFFAEGVVAQICRAAIGRLPRVQRDVIESCFFQEIPPTELARRRRVRRSTIYNSKAKAQARLHADDCFFSALNGLGLVLDRARAVALADRCRTAGCRTADASFNR